MAKGDRLAYRSASNMTDEMTPRSEAEGLSLDRVQRVLASVAIIFFVGILSAGLDLYLIYTRDVPRSDAIGLWVLCGVIGLLSAGMVLMINRLKAYHPLVLLGLIPMAVSVPWVFG